ncbi:invasion protein regulator [Lacunisphaera limnophila]|uniref:Invasion protein regulator n=1 Tax=Lacunisphaera limnophila TaxID=1838286 RepID=A0A1D8ARY7_9BACT|nr:TIR domain-containing protein [Lacunisphaera limnophila]AOS43663.1 invasion protein regulator [Lacunisphaera limnophila]
MAEPNKAVFLSYARDDAAAARRIAEALRSAGLEVWFDENELRGGDQWDAKIRKQIDACTLFVPVISTHTQTRTKGYFRLEWKLAVDQTHLLAEGVPFIAPVVIDDTKESAAVVPPEFMRVQWSRLPGALPTPSFVEQVKRLLEGKPLEGGRPRPTGVGASLDDARGRAQGAPLQKGLPRWTWGALTAVVVGVAIAFGVARKPAPAPENVPGPQAPAPAPAVAVAAPVAPAAGAKSIAVLPFANMSPEAENAFFADGIHEDVITGLAKIRDLKVISRTSVLAYREAASRNLRKIAADLGVAFVLEGSVRRAGQKVRVTAQLIDARSDEHLWAETYDRDLTDVFALQGELAREIAGALKANLTAGERALIERRPTQDSVAYDLYMQGRVLKQELSATAPPEAYAPIIALYQRAIDRDPAFVDAYVQLALLHGTMYWFGGVDPSPARRALAQAAMEAAQKIAPDAPETRIAQAAFAYTCENDWGKALAAFQAAEAGLPNDAELQYRIGISLRRLGRWPEALEHIERSVVLNPRDRSYVTTQIETLFTMRRYSAIPPLAERFLALFPGDGWLQSYFIRGQYELDGNRAAYLRKLADTPPLPADKHALQAAYVQAFRAGDLAAAEKALSDPRMVTFVSSASGVLAMPASFPRAMVTWLRGDTAGSQAAAREALAHFEAGPWSPRQQRLVNHYIALAKCYLGDGQPAEIMGQAEQLARYDSLMAALVWTESARVLALTGHPEEALVCLRRAVAGGASDTPRELRADPCYAQLKDDPRFEEILRSAKTL